MGYKSVIIGLSAIILMAMVPGRGHLKFDESFKDLGELKQGETKTYSFSPSGFSTKNKGLSLLT